MEPTNEATQKTSCLRPLMWCLAATIAGSLFTYFAMPYIAIYLDKGWDGLVSSSGDIKGAGYNHAAMLLVVLMISIFLLIPGLSFIDHLTSGMPGKKKFCTVLTLLPFHFFAAYTVAGVASLCCAIFVFFLRILRSAWDFVSPLFDLVFSWKPISWTFSNPDHFITVLAVTAVLGLVIGYRCIKAACDHRLKLSKAEEERKAKEAEEADPALEHHDAREDPEASKE